LEKTYFAETAVFHLLQADRYLNEGLFSENVMRKLPAKYTSEEWASFYNDFLGNPRSKSVFQR
jgi:hypothetical protein